MRTSMIAMPIAVFLGGCTTLAEQAAEAERDVDRMVRVYGSACEKLGFKANTDPWRNCVIGLGQKDAVRYDGYRGSFYGRYPYWGY